MEIASYLTDVYGPRLTGSPNIRAAGEWAVTALQGWGLVNVEARAMGHLRPRLDERPLRRRT